MRLRILLFSLLLGALANGCTDTNTESTNNINNTNATNDILEQCDNSVDDDGDGLTDCDDTVDCDGTVNCGCPEDDLNNGTRELAYELTFSSLPYQFDGGYLCRDASEDWYYFTAPHDAEFTIVLEYYNGTSAPMVVVYGEGPVPMGVSEPTEGAETLTFTVEAGRSYTLKVVARTPGESPYSLQLTDDAPVVTAQLEMVGFMVVGDANNDNVVDPGELIDLALGVENIGTGPTAGPVTALLSVTPGTPLSGATLIPSSAQACGMSPLSSSEAAECAPWQLQIPAGAAVGQTIALTVEFSDGETTWTHSASVVVGASPYTSLIDGFDAQGEEPVGLCDLKDILFFEEGGTLFFRQVFWTPCDISGQHMIIFEPGGSQCQHLWVWANEQRMWDCANYGEVLPLPDSYQVSAVSGVHDHLDFQIDIADIPVLTITNSVRFIAAVDSDLAPEPPPITLTW